MRAQLRDLMHSLYRRYPVGSFLVSPSRSISLDPTLPVVELAHGQAVRCELDGTRTHDRCVGVCYLEGRDIAEAIVSEGLARDCPRFRGGRVCQGGGSGGGRWRDDRAELRPARVLPAEIA